MKASRVVLSQLETALARANALYDGNLKLVDDHRVPGGMRFRLGVRDSRKYGARTSASGRHIPSASWEAHRDFLRALFAIVPDAVVYTMLATYRGAEDFEEKFPATAHRNVGSQMFPVTMRQLTV